MRTAGPSPADTPAPPHGVPTRPDALDRSLERAAERVFLSPRVVDQGAYDDFSSGLQRLIREADSRAKSLEATGEQLRKVTEQLRTLMRELQQRTDAANKALPALDASVKHASTLLDRVGSGASMQAARQLRDEIVRAVESEREAIVHASRESIARAVRTVVEQEVERALTEAKSKSEQSLAHAHPTRLQPQFLPVSGEALSISTTLEDARSQLDAIVEHARARVDACVESLERRTEVVAGELAAQLAALREDASQVIREACEKIKAQSLHAQSVQTQAVAAQAPAREPIERLSRSEATPSPEHLEHARRMLVELSERVEGAAFALDAIERRAGEIVGGAHHATNALAAQAGQVQMLLMHVQQAGAWLSHAYAHAAGRPTSPAIGHHST